MLKLEDVEQLFRVPLHGTLVAAEDLLELVSAEEPQRRHRKHPTVCVKPPASVHIQSERRDSCSVETTECVSR